MTCNDNGWSDSWNIDCGEATKAEHISTEYKTSVERQISNAKEDVEKDVRKN